MSIQNPSLNSNDVVFQLTEEASLKVPYGSADPKLRWFYFGVNTFKDFGSKITTIARSTINNTRQQSRGTVTGVEATAGLNIDLTQSNLQRLFQGFCYNDADCRTLMGGIDHPYLDNSNQFGKTPSGTAGGLLHATFTGTSTGYLPVGTLLALSDWQTSSNNGLKKVTTTTTVGGDTAVSPALATEANNNNVQRARVVGFEFPSADLSMSVVGNDVLLSSATSAWGNVGPRIGEWIYVGGDGGTTAYAGGGFFGRVAQFTSAVVTLDSTTGVQVNDAGTGKTIRVFAGTNFRNGSKRRSYTQSRIYPNYVEVVGGTPTTYPNVEHVVGAIPNNMTFNVKQKNKIDVDLDFVCMDGAQDGKNVTSGLPYTSGTFVQERADDCYNTSQDIYMMRLSILDPSILNPTPYFAYATDLKADIKNNVSPNDAIGIIGAFDAATGNFDFSASVTAYFASVASITAIRNNAPVGLQVVGAQNNQGFVLDVPLMTLSGGMPNVDKDKPVMVDLTCMGAKNANGYTMAMCFFDYLPTIAMPS